MSAAGLHLTCPVIETSNNGATTRDIHHLYHARHTHPPALWSTRQQKSGIRAVTPALSDSGSGYIHHREATASYDRSEICSGRGVYLRRRDWRYIRLCLVCVTQSARQVF